MAVMSRTIGAIILAAGMSTRMGQVKQLVPFRGKPLFRHAVDAAVTGGLQPIVLVGGKYTGELRKHVDDPMNIEVVENKAYASGMASSLAMGIKAVTGRTDAAIVFLADQPFVPLRVIEALIEHYDRHRAQGIRMVRPVYKGTPGHPVLFDADLFPEFEQIRGDEGGKSIIQKHHARLKPVPFEHSEWGWDIDTPDDLLKLENADLT